jgi:hypothetical protein
VLMAHNKESKAIQSAKQHRLAPSLLQYSQPLAGSVAMLRRAVLAFPSNAERYCHTPAHHSSTWMRKQYCMCNHVDTNPDPRAETRSSGYSGCVALNSTVLYFNGGRS